MGYDLATAKFDRPSARLRRSYLLCSVPRTGSSLLAEALHCLGGLGTPIEYFDRTATFAWLTARWDCPDLPTYLRVLHARRTTSDGVFGAKLHWFQLQQVSAELHVEPAQAIRRIAPGCDRYVWVRRADRDAQAVSWAIAEQTGGWGLRSPQAAASDPVYRFDDIQSCRRRIDDGEAGWAGLFARLGVTPLEVTYERLAGDYAATVAQVAAFLGTPVAPAAVPPPRLRRQAGARSSAFLARYLSERTDQP